MTREPRQPAAGEQAGHEPRSVFEMISNPMQIHEVKWAEVGVGQDRVEALAAICMDVLPEDNMKKRSQQHNKSLENYMKLALIAAGNRETMLWYLDNYMGYLTAEGDNDLRRAEDGLAIWAPLAEICGDTRLKDDIEDKCFEILFPEERQEVIDTYEDLGGREALDVFLDFYSSSLSDHILEYIETRSGSSGLKIIISDRPKTDIGVWRTAVRKEAENPGQERSYDLPDFLGIRVILDHEDPEVAVDACRSAAQATAEVLDPVPGRYKNYIENPKKNGYRSIHNTFWAEIGSGEQGRYARMEVQFRTAQMHDEAENGVGLSHMGYDAATKYTPGRLPPWEIDSISFKPYEWRVRAHDFESGDYTLFFSDVKLIFSKEGNLYELPAEGTYIDYAFATHTVHALYAERFYEDGSDAPRKRGSLVPAYSVVRYTKSNTIQCNEDWLSEAVTHRARRDIKRHVNKTTRMAGHLVAGFTRLRKNYRELDGYDLEGIVKKIDDDARMVAEVSAAYGYPIRSVEGLVSVLGREKKSKTRALAGFILDMFNSDFDPAAPKLDKVAEATHILTAEGLETSLLHRQGCCPGVIGQFYAYPRTGRGYSVHRLSCSSNADDPSTPTPCKWVKKKTPD